MKEFIEELQEEFLDFIEDFGDHLINRPPRHEVKKKTTVINGQTTLIRPAYLFAERVDNAIKIIFGASILISAFTATFIGFASLSDLIEVLITTVPGRLAMAIIGFSYLAIAIWKTLHLTSKN